MAETAIEWATDVWNPVVGCTRASAGCDNCYAVRMTHRLEAMGQSKYAGLTVLNAKGDRHFNGVVRCDEDALKLPLSWRKPRRIFVNSMSDLFHRDVPSWFINRVFQTMEATPQHLYMILTKRPERMADFVRHHDRGQWRDPLKNVCLGVSIENLDAWRMRYLPLTVCPAAVRFISFEPLLGDIPMLPELLTDRMIQWAIVGGESGPGARPCCLEWIDAILRSCRAGGVPVFVKQLGAVPITTNANLYDFPEGVNVITQGGLAGKYLAAGVVKLQDRKGGNPAEWPEDFRVRQMPATNRAPAKTD